MTTTKDKIRPRRGAPWALVVASVATLVMMSGCEEAVGPDPSETPEATSESGDDTLASVEQAAEYPPEGDFSACESRIAVDDFTTDLPPELEVVGGRLRLRGQNESRPDLWIANSGRSEVVRINTETEAIVSRYRVGSSPSRTAINADFDMVVANRNSRSVHFIDSDCVCPPGVACTSCTLWTQNVSSGARGLTFDREGNIYVGGYDDYIRRLDASDGSILNTWNFRSIHWNTLPSIFRSANDFHNYGMVADAAGLLWIASLHQGRIWCFNPDEGRICGVFRNPRSNTSSFYGITIDAEQNVWAGGWGAQNLVRIDRADFDAVREAGGFPAGGGFGGGFDNVRVNSYRGSGMRNTRGVAVDGDGMVYVADSHSGRVWKFDPDEERFIGQWPVCSNTIGVGIAEDGDVWSMCHGGDSAQHWTPTGSLLRTIYLGSGARPYSYSDFTGFALLNFTLPAGQWRQRFDCGAEGCGFDYIDFDADVPEGAALRVRYRTSDNGTDWSAWSTPYDDPPHYRAPDGSTPRFLELEVEFEANAAGESPSLGSIDVWQCPQMNDPQGPAVDDRWVVSPTNYGISWAFTDFSWPELRFEGVDESGIIRCRQDSTTSRGMGARYEGTGGATPACREEGHQVNTQLTRRFRSARRLPNGTWERSAFSAPVSGYTLVNTPEEGFDGRILYTGFDRVQVNWCRPARNDSADLTGAQLVRSSSLAFNPSDPGYAVISDFTDGNRGYASPTNFCGSFMDEGLERGTTYYYRLVYRNGDGIESDPLVMSTTTFGSACCYLGVCVGVCADGQLGPAGCEPPDAYENPEISCDGLDNDCDGFIDEGLLNACGTCGNPPAEVCDGVDNDCNGSIDDDPVDGTLYYRDADGDDYGSDTDTINACSRPTGYTDIGGDCNDGDSTVHPGIDLDLCNLVDDDCDGWVDEDDPGVTYYRDGDEDGFGGTDELLSCDEPDGYVTTSDDCNDDRDDVYPEAPELCDGVDNDCDTVIDEGWILANISVDEVNLISEVGLDTCDNDFDGEVCAGNLAVTVTVTNIGDQVVPGSAPISFFHGGPATERRDAGSFGADVPVGESITRTICYGIVNADAPIDIHATITPAGDSACGAFSGVLEDQSIAQGDEICDGIDNDCDGNVDESPEACGAIRDCISDRGEYVCRATATDYGSSESASTEEPAEEEAESTDESEFGAPASTPDGAGRSGCSSAPARTPAGWAWLMVGAALIAGRERRRRA